ncbi:conserved hypothetical protein [Treponema primitia ZAS-2]|uniref:Ribosomal processing cysteine protease Prp n=1 Tax=Treponema primitia (strain ATCC BAA-887 / DSM 12427 / ZAS-2) TaxID=545694 RepID=F5YJH2_TREPZ|nr:ribosomal-processing cysteine protease Prp [Treponema primitia]AEF86933.1 conserved hypothetical protein [Treponema primitia ZAS-2]
MIHIGAVLDGTGLLRSCTVKGHAGAGPKGDDIVCAAVSVLTRTALRILSEKEGIMVQGEAPERGLVRMEIDYTGEGREFLSAAGTFLLEGLKSISEEFPEYCTMNVNRQITEE